MIRALVVNIELEKWIAASAAIHFYLNQLRFKQNLNHVPIDCYI